MAGGLLAWLVGGNRDARRFLVTIAALGAAAAGIALAQHRAPGGHLDLLSTALLVLAEAGTCTATIWIGWRIRSAVVLGTSVFQGGLLATELLSQGLEHASFRVDSLSLILILIINLVGPCILFYALGYMDAHKHQQGEPHEAASDGQFFFFLVAFLGLMNGLVLADDFHSLALFWEGTTLCSFFLIGHNRTLQAKESARRALVLNSVGGAALSLAGFLAAGRGHSSLSVLVTHTNDLLPVALLCLAAFIKSAQFPFQSWLLGAMVAPSPVSALLHSSTMVKAGSYLILRLAPAFGHTPLAILVALIGAFSFAVASGIAVSQRDGKRVLAYSTVANLGLIAACAAIYSPLAYSAALVILVFHAVSKALLFLCMGTIEQRIGSRQIELMSGLMFKMPLTTMIMVIGMISMIVPPFGMLIGKWIAIQSAAQLPLILILFIFGSALTVLFWAKWIGRIITTSYHESYVVEDVPLSMRISMLTLTAGVLWCGFGAFPLYRAWLEPIAHEFSVAPQPASDFLLAAVRSFSETPMVMLLLAVSVLSLVSLLGINKKHLRRPYLCGENVGEGDRQEGYEFFSDRDLPVPANVPPSFFLDVVGEARATLWANGVALLLVLSLFARLVFV